MYEEELVNNRTLKNRSEIEKYENAVNKILRRNDVNDIGVLVQGFKDDTEEDNVMFGLVHAIDYYKDISEIDVNMEILAKSIYKMRGEAEEWANVLLYRILNTEGYPEVYKRALNTLG